MSATPPTAAASDPWLQEPLEGVRLIEASAGTGKTFTLATLVTRLVVERDLRLAQVLAVTFTDAATQELRKRIRERLQLALALAGSAPGEGEAAEAALTRALLDTHLQRSGEPVAALRRRLRRAVDDIDLAAVFTIHGFCARVLREHALESGQGFDPPELLANDRDLREEVATDLWRAHGIDATTVDDLATLWKEGPAALAQDLPVLLREPVLLPPARPLPPEAVGDALVALENAGAVLRAAWHREGEGFLDMLSAAIDADVMNRGIYKQDWLADLRGWLRAFAAGAAQAMDPHQKLHKLSADELAKGTKKDHKARTPAAPVLGAAIPAMLEARRRVDEVHEQRRANLLHRLRDDARQRIAALKRRRRVQTYDDLIDGVADALEGEHGEELVQRLRAQYHVALVDEFQDTDARQWRIFERVFGAGSADESAGPADPTSARPRDPQARFLALIGDPKQAIYGFRGGDVHTYLDACAVAARAPLLAHNFRSRPSLLGAVEALYTQAGEDAFVDGRIRFHPVEAGGQRGDDDFQYGGVTAPALTVWHAPLPPRDGNGKTRPWSAGDSRQLATDACVAAIHFALAEGRAGTATLAGKDGLRAVRPGDIAVLVRNHAEAARIQHALAEAGIPAVAAGRQSLFATTEARELHALLLALLHGADDGRLRAALATVLVGVDAATLDRFDAPEDGGDHHRHWQQQALAWRERLLRGGPLALVGDLCAAGSDRLLGLSDGERRVSNYLQLAEALQEAQARTLGLQGLVDWLAHRIATADENDETQLLRLESDARRVQIVTLHKSKGLEYPLVFLPFAGIGRRGRSPGRNCVVHAPDGGRRLHWKFALPEAGWDAASEAWKREQRAEDARLLYVGLTRAEHALWLATGDFHQHGQSALAPMLADLEALAGVDGVQLDHGMPPALPRLPPESDAAVPPARPVTRALSHDWWVYSFTQLAHADAGGDPSSAATLPAAGGNDEPPPPDATGAEADPGADAPGGPPSDPRFAGNRYGVALHAAFEHTDFAAWRGWRPGDAAPAGEHAVLAAALEDGGYAAAELDDGIALTTALIGHSLTVVLPEGVRLCDVPAGERRAEIEFQFALQPTRVEALLRLLHAHGVVAARQGFGLRQRLEGLMTGLVDLTYQHDGRWYVLDYKSNRLPRYDAPGLEAAMAHSEYDLQALIYTLALHRWLRFRLGDGYDYARDFGGIRYLFCRGVDAARGGAGGPGLHAQRFAPELVHALDALFGLPAAGVAA